MLSHERHAAWEPLCRVGLRESLREDIQQIFSVRRYCAKSEHNRKERANCSHHCVLHHAWRELRAAWLTLQSRRIRRMQKERPQDRLLHTGTLIPNGGKAPAPARNAEGGNCIAVNCTTVYEDSFLVYR